MSTPEQDHGAAAPGTDAYPGALQEIESKLIANRRRAAGADSSLPRIGLALSGGGVRSATFALGVLQALAARRCLAKFDFLSTVSGGGYIGSFLSRFFSRRDVDSNAVEEILDPQSRRSKKVAELEIGDVLSWLRENGRYLAPTGSGDLLTGAAVMLRNWVAVHVVLTSLFLMLLLIPQLLREWLLMMFPALDSLDSHLSGAPTDGVMAQLHLSANPPAPLPQSGMRWSLYAALIPCVIGFWVVPAGWAYWLSPPRVKLSEWRQSLVTFAVWGGYFFVWIVALAGLFLAPPHDVWIRRTAVIVLLAAVPTLLFRIVAWFAADKGKAVADSSRREYIRRKLSDSLKVGLVALGALSLFVLIDSFGQTLYTKAIDPNISVAKWIGGLLGTLTAVAAGARRFVLAVAPLDKMRQMASSIVKVSGTAAAIGLYLIVLSALDALAHGLVWDFGPATHCGSANGIALAVFVALVILNLCFGNAWTFINDSTIQPLYRSRLARAYLGATNDKRVPAAGSKDFSRVTAVVPGDDIAIDRLWWNKTRSTANEVPRSSVGHDSAPLHLINVTINETLDGRTGIQNNDRRGVGMAIGPAGLSAGIKHHVVVAKKGWARFPLQGFRVFNYAASELEQPGPPFEPLTLAQWTGLSGAAFSTGLGARTSLGLSLLAGFFNIRLGYWWDSRVDPITRFEPRWWRRFVAFALRRPEPEYGNLIDGSLKKSWLGRAFTWAFSLQSFLFDEFVARFHGTGRRWWYITDGGHFENMGAYELVRRRVPLIFIVDAEADSNYRFEGLSNLVRKARIDFKAEIRFVDDVASRLGKLGLPKYFGSLDMLRPGSKKSDTPPDDGPKLSACHAALAQVCYDGATEPTSWIVYLKPSLSGDEPADIVHYRSENPEFPQQATSDQFFDEAQWESYRRLGEHIGRKIFSEGLAPYVRLTSLA